MGIADGLLQLGAVGAVVRYGYVTRRDARDIAKTSLNGTLKLILRGVRRLIITKLCIVVAAVIALDGDAPFAPIALRFVLCAVIYVTIEDLWTRRELIRRELARR